MVVVFSAHNATKSAGVVCGSPDKCIGQLFRSNRDHDGLPVAEFQTPRDGVWCPGGCARAKVRIAVRGSHLGNVGFAPVRAVSTDGALTRLEPRGHGPRPGNCTPNGNRIGRISALGSVQEFDRINTRLGYEY